MSLYGGREGIGGLHCGLHSDYIMSRESFLATSDLEYTVEKKKHNILTINMVNVDARVHIYITKAL